MRTLRDYINLINEDPINIDVRGTQRAAMSKINPADYPDERAYAQAAAAAGNTAGATALQQGSTASHPGNPEDWARGINPPVDWVKDNATGKYSPPQTTATPVAEPAAAAPLPAPAPAPKQWATGVLGVGSQGPEVKALQKRLGIPDDGSYGPATKQAVIDLQKKLGVTADGAYGPQTKAAHDKSGQGGMTSATPTVSQTAPDQVNQTQQTFNATQGVAQGRIDPNSARGQATIAQPVTPTPPGNPGGAGKNATFTPDQIAAAQEALKDPKISARDKAFYTDMIARQPAPAPATAPAKVMVKPADPMQANIWMRDYGKTHNPDGTPKVVSEGTGYNELERIVSLVHYR